MNTIWIFLLSQMPEYLRIALLSLAKRKSGDSQWLTIHTYPYKGNIQF